MATAPFELWIDLAAISSAVRSSGTVTVTTATPHGITTGAYIQMEGATNVAGTSMNGVYQATVASGTTFTYTSSGTAGTGVTASACISYDLLNPLINYTGAAKRVRSTSVQTQCSLPSAETALEQAARSLSHKMTWAQMDRGSSSFLIRRGSDLSRKTQGRRLLQMAATSCLPPLFPISPQE